MVSCGVLRSICLMWCHVVLNGVQGFLWCFDVSLFHEGSCIVQWCHVVPGGLLQASEVCVLYGVTQSFLLFSGVVWGFEVLLSNVGLSC